jgi:L-lactate dehydrogenase complex protein LldF
MSSLCGACGEACPVGIPLQDLLVRERARSSSPQTRKSALAFRAWSRLWRRPGTYRAWMAGWRLMLRARGKGGWARELPGPGAGWTQVRDMPTKWPPHR